VPDVQLIRSSADHHVDEAAEIWALATCARERDPDVPPLAVSRPLIEQVLAAPRSLLLVAVVHPTRTLGFAAIEPFSAEEPLTAHVRYVAVRPQAWGLGLGARLMGALPGELELLGYLRACLSVYVDNDRAVALYERSGWRPSGREEPSPVSGKLKRFYELTV
jgi:ribosomal protein S18 acetylase RimI-like enzyme